MNILITLLTWILVLNCFFLVFLILIQLPKKESGSGLAFGGGALDMALGAGAGNVLTRITKFSASLFLGLCMILAVISNSSSNLISERLGTQPSITATNSVSNTGNTIIPNTTTTTEPSNSAETPTPLNATDPVTSEQSAKPTEGEGNK
ncbi:MAG: preprotein translocase subunit SecG [Verrucomicrobiales bacterium]|nr:preprotein translocase subunit SecG [Verrucomicrobiales bacterium]MBE86766.1 preprotein translocase subunit SecG [Verrucomicrobiales bacterium]|tara:strand:- start:3088 stop:3534 length:447 start_codon:yes stop_codon:yes gene_type:complete